MEICHAHNLGTKSVAGEKRFGVRVRLASNDPFANIVGDKWQTTHWYADADTRDAALRDMSSRHVYSRIGDEPRLIFEAVDR